MASINSPRIATFKAGAAIAKGKCVKPGADRDHVLVSAAATSKNVGIAQNAVTTAEDKVEVALPGGGAKALLAGTVSYGDLLAPDSSGAFVATTTAGDRYVAMAMEDGVAADIIAVEVVCGLI